MSAPYVDRTPPVTATETSTIEIVQDREIDESGDDFGAVGVYWTKGHGHSPDKFVRAVIDHCLEYEGGVPAIRWEDKPVELWQYVREVGDSLEYVRSIEPPADYRHRQEAYAITLLDVWEHQRKRGARKCQICKCREPWSTSAPIRVCIEPSREDRQEMTVYVTMCSEHARHFPGPSYRVFMEPAGTTLLLPTTEKEAP